MTSQYFLRQKYVLQRDNATGHVIAGVAMEGVSIDLE